MILQHTIGKDARQFEQRKIFMQVAAQVDAVADALELVALERVEHAELKFGTRRGFFTRHTARFASGTQTLPEAFGFDGIVCKRFRHGGCDFHRFYGRHVVFINMRLIADEVVIRVKRLAI